MIDLHTHILPGLDDGASSWEEALQMAGLAVAGGISAVVATPHVVSGLYENTRRQIAGAVDLLNRFLTEKNIPLKVLPGAEYRLEPALPRHLDAGLLMTINDTGRYLLVELPPDLVPDYTEQLLYEIQLQGVTPILAHPERNPGLSQDQGRLARLAHRGVLTQLTAGSLEGRFGQRARRASLKMLGTGRAQVVASDAHSLRRRPLDVAAAARKIEVRWGPAFVRLLFSTNPRRIIAGETIEAMLPKPEPDLLSRVLRSFSFSS